MLLTSLAFLLAALVVAGGPLDDFAAQAQANGGVVKLDSRSFDLLVPQERDWSVTVQLTALGANYKCAPCQQFDPVFKTVAKAWAKVAPSERNQHFFATLDFEDGGDIFRRLGLNTAPFIYTFPPSAGPRAKKRLDPIPFDFHEAGFEALALAEGLSPFLPTPIPYKPPTNWTPIISGGVIFLIAAIGAKFVLPILANRWFWAILSIATCLIMTSGFMFVRIRGVPYVTRAQNGRTSWVAGGAQNQYGMETQVVAAIYGLLSFSSISLIVLVPRIQSKTRQTAAIYIWSGVAVLVLSILMGLFRLKSPWYPYSLFL